MLDDLKYIHQRDNSDALGIAQRQTAQLRQEFNKPELQVKPENIVYAGMGGSALAALISRSWPGHNVPFEVSRQYNIPGFVSDKTLFIASSYSGNTEETLSAISQAEQKHAQIVVLASGGKLEEIASQKGYPFLKIPKAEQPRYAVFSNLVALLTVLEAADLIKADQIKDQLNSAADFLDEQIPSWLPTVATSQNPAKKLAMELAGKSIVIYGGPLMAPAAYKWKISFNENAKNVAWWNELPEFNHNEFIGWSSHPIQKPYSVIDLRSNQEHPQVQKRFELSDRLLSGMRPAAHVVDAKGDSLLKQLVFTIVYGDFVSLYLALLNGVDPAPVDLVEKFKKELG